MTVVAGQGHQDRAASPLVGRADELASLAQALSGPPAVAVIEGEAGIGKSRLVSELRTHPALMDRRIVMGWCQAIREPFPLGPVIEAARGLDEHLLQARLSPVAGALRPLLPELTALPPLPPGLDDRAAERHRVFRGLQDVLVAVGPVVLVLEDVHWADEYTLDFLAYLLIDPSPRLSVLLTFRGEDAAADVRVVTAKLPTVVNGTHVELTPLDTTQTATMAAAILGLESVSIEFANALQERASGVPFVIKELLALVQARGAIAHADSGGRMALHELDVPAGVRDPVLERLGRLGDDARCVAEAAAVLQAPVATEVLLATSLAATTTWQGLTQVLESGLLSEQGQRVGFRHVLAAQTVRESIPGPRRRQLHARAAEALAELSPETLGQRAHHLRQAGRLDEWVDAAERAADRAESLGHDDEAVRLLAEVLGHAPLRAVRRGLLAVKLGRAVNHAWTLRDDVVSLLSDALTQRLPRAVRGELRMRLALLLDRAGGDFRLLRPLFAEAVDDLAQLPVLQAHAMAVLAFPIVPGVRLSEHRRWLRRVLQKLPAVESSALRTGLLGKVAMVQTCIGDAQWRELTDRIMADTGDAPRDRAEVAAYDSIGKCACYAGHLTIADRLLTGGLDGAVAAENQRHERSIRATVVLLDYCRGNWDQLADRTQALVDQLADHVPQRAEVEVVAGCLALAHGRLDVATRQLEETVQRLEARSAFDLLPIPAAALLRLAVGRGHAAEAAATARRFLAAAESVPFQMSATWAIAPLVEALVLVDEQEQARALIRRWARRLRGRDAPLAPAALAHARGVLAAADRRPTIATQRFLQAADRYEVVGCPYEAGQAREQGGLSLLTGGDVEAGAVQLRAAMAVFQRLGATWDHSRAANLARQHGMAATAPRRGGRPSYGNNLSPREYGVAERAAKGWTNKEIAADLFLSVHTIEQHVTASMRKLEVRSRAAIASRLPHARHDRPGSAPRTS